MSLLYSPGSKIGAKTRKISLPYTSLPARKPWFFLIGPSGGCAISLKIVE